MLAGKVPKARNLAQELLELAERNRNAAMRVGGRHALAQTNFYLGEFTTSRKHAEAGIAAYDRKEHRFPNWPGGQPGTQCYIWAALAAWMLGFPDRARQLGESALALASEDAQRRYGIFLALSVLGVAYDNDLKLTSGAIDWRSLSALMEGPTLLIGDNREIALASSR